MFDNKEEDKEDQKELQSSLHYEIGKICLNEDKKQNLFLEKAKKVTTSSSAISTITELVFYYITTNLIGDLTAFSNHGNRRLINVDDVKLVLRKDIKNLEKLEDFCKKKRKNDYNDSNKNGVSGQRKGVRENKYQINKENVDIISLDSTTKTSKKIIGVSEGDNITEDDIFQSCSSSDEDTAGSGEPKLFRENFQLLKETDDRISLESTTDVCGKVKSRIIDANDRNTEDDLFQFHCCNSNEENTTKGKRKKDLEKLLRKTIRDEELKNTSSDEEHNDEITKKIKSSRTNAKRGRQDLINFHYNLEDLEETLQKSLSEEELKDTSSEDEGADKISGKRRKLRKVI